MAGKVQFVREKEGKSRYVNLAEEGGWVEEAKKKKNSHCEKVLLLLLQSMSTQPTSLA